MDAKYKKELSSTILKLPPDLPATRAAVFALGVTIIWSPAQFDAYWPFVDNLWVRNKPDEPMTKKGTRASYWYCRLHQGEIASKGFGKRAKKLRTAPKCAMKMKIIKRFDVDDVDKPLVSISLSIHTDRKNPCSTHNHQLDFVDLVKCNSYIMNAAGQQVAFGYEPADIYRVLVGVKWTGNLLALHTAGGRHFNRKDVNNAGVEWRKAHPDMRYAGARLGWEQQRLALLSEIRDRQDVLVANIEARRETDGEIAYATVFAKRSE